VLDQHSRGTLLQLPGENLSYPLVDENSQKYIAKIAADDQPESFVEV
jgi:hypothetical protein